MTITQIAEKAAEIINDGAINLSVPTNEGGILVKECVKSVYYELITLYAPLIKRETLTASNDRIAYSALQYIPLRIKEVYYGGETTDYTEYDEYITVYDGDGQYEVCYCACPTEPADVGEIELAPKFTCRVMADGAASEYFLRKGMLDEASFYRNRFYNAVKNLTQKTKSFTLRIRG